MNEKESRCFIHPHLREERIKRIIIEWPSAERLRNVLRKHLASVCLSADLLKTAFRLILEGATFDETTKLYKTILEDVPEGLFGHELVLRTRQAAKSQKYQLDFKLCSSFTGASLDLMNKSHVLTAALFFGGEGINKRGDLHDIVTELGFQPKSAEMLSYEEGEKLYRWKEAVRT